MIRIAIIVADFYPDIADGLLASCQKTLAAAGAQQAAPIRVPGALEIPLALQHAAATRQPDAMIALGCVIRGETFHFDIVCHTSAIGLQQVQLSTRLPIGNGILTVDNREQALARLHKGSAAADAALRLLAEFRRAP